MKYLNINPSILTKMKYLFSLIIILIACTCVRAQATYYIDTLPSNGDSARLRVVDILPNGADQVHTEPYDSTYKVIEYAKVLFRQSGFVGTYLHEGTIPAETALLETSKYPFGFSARQDSLYAELVRFDADPLADTLYFSDLVGSYEMIAGTFFGQAYCGMIDESFTIERDTPTRLILMNFPRPPAVISPVSSNMLRTDGVGGIASIVFIRDPVTGYWRSPEGCVYRKL